MKHKNDIIEQFDAYLDGELTPDEAQRVEQAIAADAELAAEFASLQAVRKLVRNLPRHKAGPDFVQRVMERAERVTLVAEPAAAPEKAILPWARHLATAALVLIAVCVGGVIAVTIYKTPDIRKTIAARNHAEPVRTQGDSSEADTTLAKAIEAKDKEAGPAAATQPGEFEHGSHRAADSLLTRLDGGEGALRYEIDTDDVELTRREVGKLVGQFNLKKNESSLADQSQAADMPDTLEYRVTVPAAKAGEFRANLEQICREDEVRQEAKQTGCVVGKSAPAGLVDKLRAAHKFGGKALDDRAQTKLYESAKPAGETIGKGEGNGSGGGKVAIGLLTNGVSPTSESSPEIAPNMPALPCTLPAATVAASPAPAGVPTAVAAPSAPTARLAPVKEPAVAAAPLAPTGTPSAPTSAPAAPDIAATRIAMANPKAGSADGGWTAKELGKLAETAGGSVSYGTLNKTLPAQTQAEPAAISRTERPAGEERDVAFVIVLRDAKLKGRASTAPASTPASEPATTGPASAP